MSWVILLSVGIGILSGMMIIPPSISQHSGVLINIGLCFLFFWVGLDIGKSKENVAKLREYGWRIVLVPIGVAIGSISATMLAGMMMGYTAGEAGAVGAGFGWYSLSGVLISDLHSVKLGTIAFITNVSRELVALIIIPFVAKKVGFLESIAPAGATAMDTTLPVISRATSPEISIIAFLTGVLLTAVVPVLVPLLLKLPF
ncbi:MAG: lysine exporter LysO family protein [Bacillota bacterium]|nr:lysine exporter LysO family protein [Bacillota bacterium]